MVVVFAFKFVYFGALMVSVGLLDVMQPAEYLCQLSQRFCSKTDERRKPVGKLANPGMPRSVC